MGVIFTGIGSTLALLVDATQGLLLVKIISDCTYQKDN